MPETMVNRRPAAASVVNLPRLTEPRQHLQLNYFSPASTDRHAAEQFVQYIYDKHYQATLRSFYPHLVSIETLDGEIIAVTGFRFAGDDTLFSERYLNGPIESLGLLNPHMLTTRNNVVEVGNLAPAGLGQARWLIATITAWLYHAGFEHVMFTAVPALANAFTRLGLQPQFIANARKDVLSSDEASDWGTYYDSQPNVYLGNISYGYTQLSQKIDSKMPRLRALWNDACINGNRLNMKKLVVA